MANQISARGQATLSVCHMAGMIDLAALPLWVGTLMRFYGLAAPRAGLIVTTFLISVVASSVVVAPLFSRVRHRPLACLGFAVAAGAFAVASSLPAGADSANALLLLHALAGCGVGAALSVTHGMIGRSANPHRLFGVANVAMAVLAIIMFATLPTLIAARGGPTVFQAFAITMSVAAVVALLFFPKAHPKDTVTRESASPVRQPLPKAAWFTIGTIICLALNQSVVFAFVERIGASRGFGDIAVQHVLIVTGLINLAPGILAVLLQKRLSALGVGIAGPILQALLALCITAASTYALFALPSVFYVALVIFTTTFMFGLLTEVDTSGRAVAATPAMMMIGSALGPALGGGIVAWIGYPGLGWIVLLIACAAVWLMVLTRRDLARAAVPASAKTA
ncbi:putative MFS family arabinose efflux permease [Xanthomonas translucens]